MRSLPRSKPLRRTPFRSKPRRPKQTGEWHPQIVRLDAQGMADLRWARFKLSGGYCEGVKDDGRRCLKAIDWQGCRRFELAHVKARGKSGSDTLENTRCLCQYGPDPCHRGAAASDHPGPQLRWMK